MMNTIAEKHASLISGLNELYAILIAMRYISAHDVVQPPHTADAIPDEIFQPLGYEPETIELMRLMPVLRTEVAWGWNQEGTEILPRSKVVNYFVGHDTDWIEYLRWGDNCFSYDTKLLPPWMLRLTLGDMYPGQNGLDLIYNTRTQIIIEWGHSDVKLWDEAPSRPAETVLAEIVESFMRLEWVPQPSLDNRMPPENHIIDNPIRHLNAMRRNDPLALDPASAIEHLRRDGVEQNVLVWSEYVNRWRSLQNLYKDCQWGTENYDGEELGRRRDELFGGLEDLEKQWHDARRIAQLQREDVWTAREGIIAARQSFWAESAGANAV